MSIIENINERLSFDMETIGCGGEKEIEQVLSKSPIQLPDDYRTLKKHCRSSKCRSRVLG